LSISDRSVWAFWKEPGRICFARRFFTDSLYGRDDNIEKAKEQGVEGVAPVMNS
jgi:hypothetical protein